ncbi:MAG: farnesyl diphosphate synthase [Lysobacterales bacterium]
MTRPELTAPLLAFAARAESVLAARLPPATQAPEQLHRAMRYSVLGGGKRLRPLLTYATGTALGASLDALDSPAAAVEVIHAYSLVHDDLPAMDDDALRRGQPTCHVAFGEATAILAGDALQAFAFELIAHCGLTPLDRCGAMLGLLAHACGSEGMAGGQALDLDAVGQVLTLTELERMHSLKTGALIRASVLLGAAAANCTEPDTLAALARYGLAVGLAFQIRDDILDIEGATIVIGKTRGKDAMSAKPTYPGLLGMDGAREHAFAQRGIALTALAESGVDSGPLADLARYSVDRLS